jgi:uncharacterized membrane-anchored protein YjiN (DUF445 family)
MKSREEIVATKLYDLLSDYRIESYLVGRYFAQSARVEVYDKFEEMVESARQEKKDRVEWLKKIITGDTDMETSSDFDRKAEVLQQALYHDDMEIMSEFFDQYEYLVACWTAGAYVEAMIDRLSPRAVEDIEAVFDRLLETFGLEDDGTITTFADILERS